MWFDNNGPRKVYCVDLDDTLTLQSKYWKEEPEPRWDMIERVRELYSQGNVVIIWTARQWSYAPLTAAWLTRYSVPYHGLKMEKGGCDYLVDDHAITFEQFLEK